MCEVVVSRGERGTGKEVEVRVRVGGDVGRGKGERGGGNTNKGGG